MTPRRAVVVVLAALAALVAIAVAGGYNVAASSGHLPGVTTLISWTLGNSVYWRSLGESMPDVADDSPSVSGAGHYHLVCRQCHGAPGEPVPESMRNMVPPPPHASELVGDWRPGELFWIVKHGIKMTAMPAWPAQERDDEVREVVAFTQRLPGMDRAAYERAVGDRAPPPAAAAEDLRSRCARCHGADGVGPRGSGVPVIAGLGESYLRAALAAYRDGHRPSGFMQVQAADLSTEQIAALARHYARRPASRENTGAVRESLAGAGRRIAQRGVHERRVPACAACHGPAEGRRADAYPRLGGQRPQYLRSQLELFRSAMRGGSEFAPLMAFAARNLTDEDIEALAAYYGSLPEGTRD